MVTVGLKIDSHYFSVEDIPASHTSSVPRRQSPQRHHQLVPPHGPGPGRGARADHRCHDESRPRPVLPPRQVHDFFVGNLLVVIPRRWGVLSRFRLREVRWRRGVVRSRRLRGLVFWKRDRCHPGGVDHRGGRRGSFHLARHFRDSGCCEEADDDQTR